MAAIFKYIILAMNMISMKGFKSYAEETLNNLHPRINLVLGRNGEGKSNFFKAINFLLTDRVACNRNEFNAYTHRALDNAPQSISVEAYLRNRTAAGQSELLSIERTWSPDLREDFRVEGQSFQKEEVENYLESLGIAYSNSYHIVQQGRIDLVVRMDDFELYGLLEEATGLRKYERRYEEAQTHMRRNAIQKEEIAGMLAEIEGRLKVYETHKEEYELHNCEELVQKLRSKQDYEHQLEANNRKLEDVKHGEQRLAEELGRLRNKAKDMHQQLQQLQQDIAINQRQLYECQGSPEDEELQQAPAASQQLQDINARLKKAAEGRQRLKAEWQRKSKEAEAARKEMEAYKARFSAMTSQVEGEKLAKSGKGKAEGRAAIDRLQQNIRETDEDIRKMGAYLKEFKVQSGAREGEEAASLKEKLGTVGLELKATKMKMFEENRVKNQLEAEVEALGQQSAAYLHRLRKALPLLDLSLLRELRRQKVSGVLGYVIEFVEIEPSVAFAYEMAGAGRLCTLLVEDEAACAKVIETNRKMKGRQVNILPVTVLRRQPTEKHNAPAAADCLSLLNEEWLKVKAHSLGEDFDRQLRKLLNNSFGKYLLVESYELALDVSKRYHLNCITGDRELVYSEGCFCKVGRDEAQEDRLELYYSHAHKEKLIANAQARLSESGKQLQALQNVELELNKKKVALEGDAAAVARKLDEITYQKRAVAKVQEQVENLERKRSALETELKRTQEMLEAVEGKKLKPVNAREYKELEDLFNERLRAYNQRNEEEYEVERQLGALAREEEELAEQAGKLKQELDFTRSFSADYVNEREYRQRLERSLQEREARALELQRDLFAVGEEVCERQAAEGAALEQVALVGEQVAYYEARIEELGSIEASLPELEERSNSLSMSFSRAQGRRRHFYTAKEKIFFSKIALYRNQLNEKRALYHELLQAEATLVQMIDDCQREKEREVTAIFEKFQHHFAAIFRAITGGRSDVRLKKNQERARMANSVREKLRSAMTIMVAFQSEREVSRRWNEFSGGQKSVLAFCVLMALQKCQPAPFYVLDEVDAALDPVYLQRIVEFIRNESANSQYFISSFKQEMLEFPEEICNYYLVNMTDRVSRIGRISQGEAKATLASIL